MSNVSRVSVVLTVLNESKTIAETLKRLIKQSKKPDEIIVADGGSSDGTWEYLLTLSKDTAKNRQKPRIIVKQTIGNRSKGRNLAIKLASSELIAITDAGCLANQDWLEELLKKKDAEKAEVVAGFYHGLPKNNFEKAVVPYVLVMNDKINHENFLPATRSMLLTKNVWQKLEGFDEKLSDNEDYAFAHLIKKSGYKIAFAEKAQVGWQPRSNLSSFCWMIYRFARGDARAQIFRPKVFLIFVRYLFLLLLAMSGYYWLILAFLCVYFFWAIAKNQRYVDGGWFYLPILQVLSDWAVMLGTFAGVLSRACNKTVGNC
ncbi:MAG: glycosyltransferase [Patescibacteria group bacterium]